MSSNRDTGFTLVELLIVIVVLGILAAVVVPQFSSASDQATKSALSSQLRTVSSQLELFKAQNAGAYPVLGASAPSPSNNGWGQMMSQGYLKSMPFNSYVGKGNIIVGTSAAMATLKAAATSGWATDNAGLVWAVGFDPTQTATYPNGKFAHEP